MDPKILYCVELDKIKDLPDYLRIRAEKRFLVVKEYLGIMAAKRAKSVRTDPFLLNSTLRRYCGLKHLAVRTFCNWLSTYREGGIEKLVPRYGSRQNSIGAILHGRDSSSKKQNYTLTVTLGIRVDKGAERSLKEIGKVIAASPLITPESKAAFARGFQRLCGLTVQRYRLRLQPPLTASEKRRLERYRAGNHKKHSAKAAAILMIAKGLSMLEIGLEVNAPVRTIYRWFSEFKAKRLDSIETHMVKKIRLEEWELRKTRIIDIVHKMPALYGINRSTWTYSAIAEAYVKEYMVPMSESKVQRAIKETGYTWRHARKVLTSPDLHYREKVERLLQVLSQLKREEAFFFIDEVGPYRVKRYGGVHLAPPGAPQTVPEFQKSKGRVQFVAALEAMSNQLTWLFCEKKGSESLVALLVKLVNQYSDRTKVYLTWDAIGVHSAKNLKKWIDDHNSAMIAPVVEVVPLPANAQFLNVIEAVFGGMKRAVICNSDYQSSQEMQDAIAKHFEDRNCYYRENPKRAGDKIWDKERFDLDKLPGGLFKKM